MTSLAPSVVPAAPARGDERVSASLLRQHLRQGAGKREAAIARFLAFLYGMGALAGLDLRYDLGRTQGRDLSVGMAAVAVYYLVLSEAFRRGHYRPFFRWINVAIENSAPAILFALALHFHGPEFALTGPPLTAWSMMILVSAVRTDRILALTAGAVAACEYLTIYFLFALPRLPAQGLETLAPSFVFIRAFLLLASGVLTAVLAELLVREAEATLQAVREKDVMGKYFLEERIGAGGMAEVFRAKYSPEGGFVKEVAIKQMSPALTDDPEFVALFRREAELGSLLSHPNVVQVFDAGVHQGRYFLAQEYVDGVSLSAALQALDRPLPIAALAYLGAELAEALDYIHNRCTSAGRPLRLIHRDVNPPNILLSRFGEVKLADFGIARAAASAALTGAAVLRGKQRFLAPEQILGGQDDPRSDLFSLGLTLYLALTGRSAFQGANDGEILRAILEAPVDPPSKWRSAVPPELDIAILGLLQKELGKRTQNAGELRSRLCLLRDAAAPFPHGKAELAAYVEAALAVRKAVAAAG